MRFLKSVLKIFGYFLLTLIVLLLALVIYIKVVSDVDPPKVAHGNFENLRVQTGPGNLKYIGNNWLRKNEFGLFEMYVSGSPFELGVINGKLCQQQIADQEIAFTEQIKTMIPSANYLKFLKYVIGFVNKDLPDYVLPEYQKEIYGISLSAADSFNWIGENYDRILNYHAAHDIGHALQNMMLVGCTSFGVWDDATSDGGLLIGRNFDFWVGDKFSEEKIIAFYRPQNGWPFMFVTWGGFTGVVSGMNTAGLTVTINAAKSDIPYGGSATPVSLVAREIAQYASTIEEAVAIAHKRKMFVSESFLVASAKDHKAVIIEKTPDTLAVYDPNQSSILCTNHYQSQLFAQQKLNLEQKANSASVYRYGRLKELIQNDEPLTPERMAAVLRDRKGQGGKNIGNGNEKAINQLIAHHSIIFQPDSLRVWVSTAPWQLGAYVCYDLNKIFNLDGLLTDVPVDDSSRRIPADPFVKNGLQKYMRFRNEKTGFLLNGKLDTAIITQNNPEYYDAYRLAGDFCQSQKWNAAAIRFYRIALTKEIATVEERKSIEKKLARLVSDKN